MSREKEIDQWRYSLGGYKSARKHGLILSDIGLPRWIKNIEYNEMDIGSNNEITDDIEIHP